MAKTGTEIDSGMYQTVFPANDLAWMGGPGAAKLRGGWVSLATTARARARPALEAGELAGPAVLFELPQAMADSAVRAMTASWALRRCLVIRSSHVSGV